MRRTNFGSLKWTVTKSIFKLEKCDWPESENIIGQYTHNNSLVHVLGKEHRLDEPQAASCCVWTTIHPLCGGKLVPATLSTHGGNREIAATPECIQ